VVNMDPPRAPVAPAVSRGRSGLRVLFLSDHFSSPGQPGVLRTWRLAAYLCGEGDEVTVAAPDGYAPFARWRSPLPPPLPEGLHLRRLGPSRAVIGRGRVIGYAAQALHASWITLRSPRPDVVVAGLTPSLLGLGPLLAARARGIPFVVDERDLAATAASTLRLLPGPVLALGRIGQRALHARSDAVVAVTPGVARLIQGDGVPPDRIHLVPNGLEELGLAVDDSGPIRDELGWGDRTVALYAGGIGPSHDVSLILAAARLLDGRRFLVVVLGDGEDRAKLEDRAHRERLPVQFLDPRPKEDVGALCRAADLCLLPLRGDRFWECALPTKLFDYLGAGRPVILSGPRGDAAELLERSGGGILLPAADPQALADAIRTLGSDPDMRIRMGESGAAFVRAEWRRERFMPTFRNALLGAVTDPAGETARIRSVYGRYDRSSTQRGKRDMANAGSSAIAEQRWVEIGRALEGLSLPGGSRVLDLGCGGGQDLHRMGHLPGAAAWTRVGVDLLPDRLETAARAAPGARLALASGAALPFGEGTFDAIVVSTLFSSVLSDRIARGIAREAVRVLRPGGSIICYDVRYPNPLNANTRAVTGPMLRRLFPAGTIRVRAVTLIPQIARRLGSRTRTLYPRLHQVTALRSHFLARIDPDGRSTGAGPLFVTPAECRFPNMTVNQRLRMLLDRGPVEVWSPYPDAFPPDIQARAKIRRFPLSERLPSGAIRLPAFSAEVAVRALLSRLRGSRYPLIYSFQDTSAVAGWLLRRPGSGWVLDAVDDPAMELSTARQRRKRGKSSGLAARDAMIGWLLRRADLVPTIGRASDDPLPAILERNYGVTSGRILPLNQSVRVEEIRDAVRGVPRDDPPVALFVGFVSPVRGVDTLIEACRRLRHRGIDLELRLIGHLKADDRALLEDAARRDGSGLRFLGVLPSHQTLLHMARATVGVLPFPDLREMAPVQAVTGVEYLSVGTALVGSDLPGLHAVVEHGVNGYLVPPGDPEEMADAIGRLVKDPALAASFGRASAERAERFDASQVNIVLGEALRPWR
jgi:glycosyltransferase involved in cell wall biosynthesis